MAGKQTLTLLAILTLGVLTGLVGGLGVSWYLGWIPKVDVGVIGPESAISIANTYIVFTTIIFVAATIVLVIIGYVFAHQFSESKEEQLHRLSDDINRNFCSDREKGIALIDNMLKNEGIRKHVMDTLDKKITVLLDGKTRDQGNDLAMDVSDENK